MKLFARTQLKAEARIALLRSQGLNESRPLSAAPVPDPGCFIVIKYAGGVWEFRYDPLVTSRQHLAALRR